MTNVFVGDVGTKPTPSKTAATSRMKRPATRPAGHVPPTDTGKKATTDNPQPVAKNEPTDAPSKNFGHTLHKKMMTTTSRNVQTDKKKGKPSQSSGTLPGTLQGSLPPPAVLDKAIIAKVDNQLQQQTESQAPGKTARIIAGDKAPETPKAPKTPSLITQAAKPINTRPDQQIVSATSRPINKPAQSTIEQSRIKPEIIAPRISNKSPGINVQPEKAKDTGKAAADTASVSESPKTLQTSEIDLTSRAITAGKNTNEVASEMHTGDSKTTRAGKKPVMTTEPALALSPKTTGSTKPVITSTPPFNQQSGNKTTGNSEQSVIRDTPFARDISKTQLSNNPFSGPGGQSSQSRQNVLIGQENATQAVAETIADKAGADRKGHPGKTELFELPEKNKVRAETLSGKSIVQKMSQPGVLSSALQAENRSNLLANHGSNPNMELGEQVLAGNNARPAVTEPSAASAPFPKIAGNTDSDASVSEQIQQSVRSSFGEGNRQIVIRLNPPELGKVTIKFAEQADGITGLLLIDKLQTRQQIQQALPEIIQNLQDSGVQIKRLEVVLTNQQQEYTSKDQSSTAGQDSWSGQQSSTDPDSQRNNTTYDEWLRNIDNVTEFIEAQVQLTDNSINMLV